MMQESSLIDVSPPVEHCSVFHVLDFLSQLPPRQVMRSGFKIFTVFDGSAFRAQHQSVESFVMPDVLNALLARRANVQSFAFRAETISAKGKVFLINLPRP